MKDTQKCENALVAELKDPAGHVMPDEYVPGFQQWLVDGDKFIPMTKTVQTLPAGDYGMRYDRMYDKNVLFMRQPICEDLLELPMDEFDDVLNDIGTFWKSRELYDEYGYIYKRGILLYGPPGCGKTSLIALMSRQLISKQDGVVLNLTTSDDIFAFDEIMRSIREIEPDRRVIAVIEDIDNFVSERRDQAELTSKLLNLLDGKMQFDNIVIIATTNYPEELEERISNRPSRFDLRREIGPPKVRAREYYLRYKLKPRDLKSIDVEEWLRKTSGFTIDHLKELVCLVFVHKRPFEKAYAEVNGIIKRPTLKNSPVGKKERLGFAGSGGVDDDDDRIKK